MQTINIAHVVFSFGAGGIENGIVNLVNNLDPDRYRHTIVCLTNAGEFAEKIHGGNSNLIELHKKDGNDWGLPFKLRRVFKNNGIDIVHLRGWPTLIEGIIGAKLAGVKKIIYGFHGKTIQDISTRNRKRQFAEMIAVRFIDRVVTLSEIMAADYAQYARIPTSKIQVIYNGVDTEKFNNKSNIKKIRKELAINEDDFVIGSVGRLDPVKDFPTLIKAFSLFCMDIGSSKLIIVGEGPERATLEKLAKDVDVEEKTIFTGYRNDINKLMQAMNIYVQTSLYEGFSNTIVEAMAAGLPVVATDVGGNSVLIKSRTDNLLIEPANPTLLSSILLKLARNKATMSQIAKENRKTTESEFSITEMVNRYHNSYSNIITE